MAEWDEWAVRIARAHEALEGADYYAVLGVPRDAVAAAIRQAYYRRAQQLHPDRLVGAPEPGRTQAAAIYKRVSEAYQTLNDPSLRAVYDRGLAEGGKRLTITNRLSVKPREDGWFLKTEGGRKHYRAAKEALQAGNAAMAKLNLQIVLRYEGDLPELAELASAVAAASRSADPRKKP
jgi:curved DNA-binding protein CbpA